MDLGRAMKDDAEEGHTEMDTHADTCVAGPEYRVLSFTGEKVNVHPYNDEYDPVHLNRIIHRIGFKITLLDFYALHRQV